MTLVIRAADAADADLIHRFVCELAEYEREPHAVEATPETFRAQLAADRPPFECLIAELDGAPAGFALFFHNYSTWKGRPGIWLEDLFVTGNLRGRGIGAALLREVARIAVHRQCGRLEWAVLDWNEPALEFYRGLGARPLDEWTLCRLTGGALAAMSDKGRPAPS